MTKKILLIVLTFLVAIATLFYSNKISASSIPEEDDLPQCYQQADDRWGQTLYRGQTFAATGCGLCSLTNVVNYLTGNFINPTEIADYAYSIEAYNATYFSGTHQDILYRKLDDFEKKYGFKVIEGGTYFYSEPYETSMEKLKSALKKGQGIIVLVPGHFIALCDYNEQTNSFLVYDCSSAPSVRGTYAYGTWVTEQEFKTVERLNIEWYGIFEQDIQRKTSLDGVENKRNGKAEVAYYITNPGMENPYVSGTALDGRGIDYYFYYLDYKTEEHYLSCTERTDVNTNGYENMNPKKTGFKGIIDTTGLKAGTHYANIYARTNDGGLLNIAEIEMFISNVNRYDSASKTFTIDMDNCIGQKDIHESWPDGGVNKACFVANYNVSVDLGPMDLSQFTKADIYYSTNSNFDADKDGIQSVIGFKKSRNSFGYHGTPLDLKNEIAHTNMTDGTKGSFSEFRVATIDLSNTNYNGNVYINGYNQEGQFYVVSKIVFYFNNDITIPKTNYQSITNEITITPTLIKNNVYSLGAFNLSNLSYLEIEYNQAVKGTTTLYGRLNQVYDKKKSIQLQSRYALEINQKNVDNLLIEIPVTDSIKEIKIKEIKLYTNNSDQYRIENGENHKVLQYHDALNNPIYKEEDHVGVSHHVAKTCTIDGMDTVSCDYCNKILSGTVDKATGHQGKIVYANSETHNLECEECHEVLDTMKHSYDSYAYTSTNHYKTCICGARIDVEKHSFEKTGFCSVCGYECKHASYTVIKGVEPTCYEGGLSDGKVCKVCGKLFEEQEELDPLDHEYEEGICIYCGDKQIATEEPIEKTGCNKGFDLLSMGLIIPPIFMTFGFRKLTKKKEENE